MNVKPIQCGSRRLYTQPCARPSGRSRAAARSPGPSGSNPTAPRQQPRPLTAVRAQADAAASSGGDEKQSAFRKTRLITFISLWIGYACFYITRTCFNYVNPIMLKDASLGIDLTAVGFISSLLPIAYAFSKGISGFLGSTMSPRLLLSGGLAATGLACLCFGFGNAPLWFAAFWTINGLLQGLGAPACAKLLTQWYPSSERGTAWSIWTASNNVGGFASPWITGAAAGALGWRYGMWVPAAIALTIASILLFTITDKPTDKGFDPVDGGKKKADQGAEKKDDAPAKDDGPSVKDILFKEVLPNPYVWLFALSYFFVYLVRQGASTWFVHYLMNVKGVSELSTAAAQVSGLEVGGFFGALSAGTLSDIFVRRAKKANSGAGLIGVRVRVVLSYAIFTALALVGFSLCPNQPAVQWASIAAVGFGLYGPQMLIGLCGAEVVRPDAVGATQGLLGWVSYMGAACAGAPLAYLVQKLGWSMYFSIMIAAAVIASVLVVPMLNLKSFTQSEAEAA